MITNIDRQVNPSSPYFRRGRHFGLKVHVLTQRVTDWFDGRIGRTIQSVAASKWLGQMEARELYGIAPSLGISPEERDPIEKARQGEGLLVTTVRRRWPLGTSGRPAFELTTLLMSRRVQSITGEAALQ